MEFFIHRLERLDQKKEKKKTINIPAVNLVVSRVYGKQNEQNEKKKCERSMRARAEVHTRMESNRTNEFRAADAVPLACCKINFAMRARSDRKSEIARRAITILINSRNQLKDTVKKM